MPPLNSSHPVPARNPPTTGYGTNRTRLPSRNLPSIAKTRPHRTVTTRVAAMTVRKMSGGSYVPTPVLRATSARFCAFDAVDAATRASTATAASCTLPTTPREPARQARIPSVRTAATRYSPMPSPRRPAR